MHLTLASVLTSRLQKKNTRFIRGVKIIFFIVYKYIQLLIKLKRYDVVLIQSLTFYHVVFFPLLKIKSRKVYVTFWGSDLNSAGKTKKKILSFFLRYASGVSTTSEVMRLKAIKELSLKKNKTCITRFGLPTAEFLSNISEDQKIEFKKEFGISEGVVVMCTPSCDPIRQICEVIDGIKKLPEKTTEKAIFIFHLGYGCNEYKKKVIKKLDELINIRYVVIDKFLSPERTAVLRHITDIYINVALVDQLSGAMMESIYCNNIVLIGSWLNYIELNERNIDFVKVDSINPEDFSKTIQQCIDRVCGNLFPDNKEKIEDLFMWKITIHQWSAFLLQ